MTKTSNIKEVEPDHPILSLFGLRFSPYVFSSIAVSKSDLQAIFEAARWAPSSYNEQPWRYIIATKDEGEPFDKMVSCLVEGNQPWAKRAPVLALGLYCSRFKRNDKENPAAPHDLGIASAFLTVEATHRGLSVHQMIGIQADRIRRVYQLPDDVIPYTGLAIGYTGDPDLAEDLDQKYIERDRAERQRQGFEEFIFSGTFGNPAGL